MASLAVWRASSASWEGVLVVAFMDIPSEKIMRMPLDRRCLSPPHQTCDETHQSQHDENHEQDLGNTDCAGRDAAKAEERGDQRDDQEHHCVVQHAELLPRRASAVNGHLNQGYSARCPHPVSSGVQGA